MNDGTVKAEQTTALQLRDSAKHQLEQIKTLESGVDYLKKVTVIEHWARAEKKDAELQNIIAEQKLRTQRILGSLIKEGQERGEIRAPHNEKKTNSRQESVSKTLSEVGITPKQSHTFQKIAEIPEPEFETFIAEKKEAVNNAVNELTTSGAVRLADQLKNKPHVTNNSGDNEWYTPDEYSQLDCPIKAKSCYSFAQHPLFNTLYIGNYFKNQKCFTNITGGVTCY